MTETVTVEHCPNCGAPLDLDAQGRCHFCNETVTFEDGSTGSRAAKRAMHAALGLPDGFSLPMPPGQIISVLDNDAWDPVMVAFLGDPQRVELVRALASAIEAAGQRVEDADVDEDRIVQHGEQVYTPEEWWTFDLGVDLLSTVMGLEGAGRELASTTRAWVHSYDKCWADRIRHPIERAGDGPEAFREFRASIARRQVHRS